MSERESGQLARSLENLRRLGRNQNGYCGEKIDIATVLADCAVAAEKHGWKRELLRPAPGREIMALTRPHSCQSGCHLRVYLSAGIHGDEPAGPLAARRLLQENRWDPRLELAFCPCLNPTGFALGRRENEDGLDLNRQYLEPQSPEVVSHVEWLKRLPCFDLTLLLHEDWESNGFYLYELNPGERPSLGEDILRSVSRVCPIDHSELIEGRAAERGIIRPVMDLNSRPDWPEAFFLRAHKTTQSYTLEAPSDFELGTRVDSLCAAVNGALEGFLAHNECGS
jgi:murein peptide amidase A